MGVDADSGTLRHRILAAIEVVAAVAAASGVVAALNAAAPITSLGVVYLLAVLLMAIRRGQIAALAAALLSVLAFNFLFIEPLYRLTIADSREVVALGVFLIAAVVVGRLAATARRRAREAEERARLAAAREREAKVLAGVASSVLGSGGPVHDLGDIAEAASAATDSGVRLEFRGAPAPRDGEVAVTVSSGAGPGWLYGHPSRGWDREGLERLAGPLGRVVDVARERARTSAEAAEIDAARRADVAKTALLHAISHDLRSPLTAITTAASALRGSGLASDDREALLAVVDEESIRLARLVDDLLDLSRIEAGAVDPRMDWCDLHEVAARAIAQVRERHGEPPVELDASPELPLIRADAAQLERVLANLIDNAVKFSPPGTPVRVSCGSGGGRVSVRVTDRGPGIPLSRRSQVFEPFFRDRREQGSGLGLAICRGFVEANGGEIRLQSDEASGTSFAVSFPLQTQPAALR
jgi:two-component system, OmpR family, sensor histidine kinase KdpD